VNVVTLIGDLASEVQLKDVGDGRRLASFLLAVTRPGPEAKADVVRVVAWNRQGELCGEFLTRGSRIAVDGRLRARSWEGEDGKRRTSVEVVASSVQFLSGMRRADGKGTPFEPALAS
jgi:single-strand DNA-binding protein